MTKNWIFVTVARKTVEAIDICSVELVAPEGGSLPRFSAGSHIDVELPGGIVRQYSLTNDPAENHRYVLGVLRDPASRGGSRAWHDRVAEGDRLRIGAPKNHFALVCEAKRHLLLAGGIGITPILCMAERLANIGADFEMHYCTRSRDRTAFMARIEQSAFASCINFHFDDGADEQKFDIAKRLAQVESDAHLYVCGPKGFMDTVLNTARRQGWPESQLHFEFFVGADSSPEDACEFEIQLASSGRIVAVQKNQTVVQALAAVGIHISTSCEQGICGTCLTRVVAGEPDHRDIYLTPQEHAKNEQFLPCCSRSKSFRLVLDL